MLVYVQIKYSDGESSWHELFSSYNKVTTSACFEQNTEAPESPEAFYIELKANIYFFISNPSCQSWEHWHQSVCAHAFRRDAVGSQEETARCRRDTPSSETRRVARNCFAQSVVGRSPHKGDTAYERQVWLRMTERGCFNQYLLRWEVFGMIAYRLLHTTQYCLLRTASLQ